MHMGTNMDQPHLKQAGSAWSSEQIDAFHVERFDDISIERFFPGYMPSANDAGNALAKLIKELWSISNGFFSVFASKTGSYGTKF